MLGFLRWFTRDGQSGGDGGTGGSAPGGGRQGQGSHGNAARAELLANVAPTGFEDAVREWWPGGTGWWQPGSGGGGAPAGAERDGAGDEEERQPDDAAVIEGIRDALSYGALDWVVTDEEAREVIATLDDLGEEQRRRVVEELRASGHLDRLLANLSDEDRHRYARLVDELRPAEERVRDLMSTGLTDWAVTDGEASEAVDILLELPPERRAEALDGMDEDAFLALVDNVPEERRADLLDLYERSTDPARKVRLWALVHEARSRSELTDDLEAVPWWDWWSDGARRNARREAIHETTLDEIEEERDHLLARIASGDDVDVEDVEALDARKRRELEIETTRGVNLTNDSGHALDDATRTARRVWTEAELELVDVALDRIPSEQLWDNEAIREIRRADGAWSRDDDGNWHEDLDVGGNAAGGRINVFDTGVGYDRATGTLQPTRPWRTPATDALAGHEAGGTGRRAPLSLVEEVVTHEVGHTIHQGDEDLWDRWQALSDWEELDADDARELMEGDGMSAADARALVEDMADRRQDHYASRPTWTASDGTLVEIDPYGDDFLRVQGDAIPAGADWDYARTNPADHFAEIYAKAIHAPESLHEDLVEAPRQEVQDREADFNQAVADLAAAWAQGGPAFRDALEAAMEAARALQRAERARELREAQWNFFRNEVFGTDDSDIQALTAPEGREGDYEAYKREAARAMTPEQLQSVRDAWADRL